MSPPPPAETSSTDGKVAYGVGLRGLADSLPHLMNGPPLRDWPSVDLIYRCGRPNAARPATFTARRARMFAGPLAEVTEVTIARDEQQAVVLAESLPAPDTLLHNVVSLIGRVFSQWAGGTSLHGGGVIVDGRVWGVLGATERGKSTLLARLSQRGYPVVADDTLVLRGGRAFPGPRTLYLRLDAPDHLGLGPDDTRPARSGSRVALPLDPAPLYAPLAGWVVLREGPDVALNRLAAAQRLDVLMQVRMLSHLVPPGPQFLTLVDLPGFELKHPRQWRTLDDVCDRLERLGTRGERQESSMGKR